MRAYFITGASRGLGHALAKKVLGQGDCAVCIARHDAEDLRAFEETYRFVGLDLAVVDSVVAEVDRLWENAAAPRYDGLYLINNAATNSPVGLAEQGDPIEVARAVQVNLTAAMLLTNSFIRMTAGRAADRRVLNISSGAGRRAYARWSTYCATKAALDRYSECVGAEQATQPEGVRIASIAPGIIDTDMQAAIRAATEEQFPQRQQFVDYYEKGELASPHAAAAKLLRILHGDGIGFGNLLDIRDFAM